MQSTGDQKGEHSTGEWGQEETVMFLLGQSIFLQPRPGDSTENEMKVFI